MGIFSRKKDTAPVGDAAELDEDFDELADDLDEVESSDETEAEELIAVGATAQRLSPPRTRSEADSLEGYVDLGSLLLKPSGPLELRLELDESREQITGATAFVGESAVQFQVFAAPRNEGIWTEIRNEIAESVVDGGGTAEVVSGPFGEELLTRMQQAGADGNPIFVPARFVGVDGPRWFLRAVITGRAAIDPEQAHDLHELLSNAIVERGTEAMAPRELLPMTVPEAQEQGDVDPDEASEESKATSVDDLKPFERGPEITEVH